MTGKAKVKLLHTLMLKDFRWLYSGQVVSDMGNWLSYMAIMIMFTYHWDLPPSMLALFPIAIALPWIILSPFSGVWADRLSKKKLMIGCDLARALLVFLLIFAQNVWSVLIFMILIHSVATLFDPARQAAIKEYVPENELIQANSLSQLSVQLAKVVAPAIGGIIVSIWSPSIAFIINSLCFLLSALLLSKLSSSKQITTTDSNAFEEKKFFSEMLIGLKLIVKTKYLLIAVLCMFSSMFLVFLYDSFIALWSKEIGLPASMFSIIISGIGLGSLIGAVIIGTLGNRIHPIRMILSIPVITGLLFAVIGLGGMNVISMSAAGWFVIWMIIGMIGAGIPIAYGTILQTETPSTMIGKVYGSAQSIINIPIFVAPLLGAKLIIMFGIGQVFLLAGSAFSVLAIIGLVIFEIDKRKVEKRTDNIEVDSISL